MVTIQQQATIDLYAAMMEETKIRLFSIDGAVAGKTGFIGPLVQDYCYLQLRMICELIALACLVAHGDIKETKTRKVRGLWSAGEILAALENLHGNFYPRPVVQTSPQPGHHHFENSQEPHLSKAELIKLTGKCGNMLHRGTINKLLSATTPIQTNFPEIIEWAQKIANLLAVHIMMMADNVTVFVCKMNTIDHGGRVTVVLAGPPPP